jgi:predicted transposase YdaD
MPKKFDAILKHLSEQYPQDWARFAGVSGPVTVIDADVSTVTAAADKVLRVESPEPWILHLEFQASRDLTLPRRLLHYNVLLGIRHELPIRTLVILLRPDADGKELTGQVQWRLPHGRPYLEFDYELVRLWELPPEAILEGGLGTLPLAPLTNVTQLELHELIGQMSQRLDCDVPRPVADSLWTATLILLGLEYEQAFAKQLLRGVGSMKESVTYQAILEEGREKGLREGRKEGRKEGREEGRKQGRKEGHEEGRAEASRRILLVQGTKRFGTPSPKVRRKMTQISDVRVIETLVLRILDVESWAELLAELD